MKRSYPDVSTTSNTGQQTGKGPEFQVSHIPSKIRLDKQKVAQKVSLKSKNLPPIVCDTEFEYDHIVLICSTFTRFQSYLAALVRCMHFNTLPLLESYTEVKTLDGKKRISCTLSFTKQRVSVCLGTGQGLAPDEAKHEAAKNAMTMLLQKCYLIKNMKRSFSDVEISVGDVDSSETQNKMGQPVYSQVMARQNTGPKMQTMGWSGAGQGREWGATTSERQGLGLMATPAFQADGRKQAVKFNVHRGLTDLVFSPGQSPEQQFVNLGATILGRQDLGLKAEVNATPSFVTTIRKLVHKYKDQRVLLDMVFSPQLSHEQQQFVQITAARVSRKYLRTRLYGTGESQFVVLSSKFTPGDLLKKIVAEGGKTEKYEVCPPGSLSIEDFVEGFDEAAEP